MELFGLEVCQAPHELVPHGIESLKLLYLPDPIGEKETVSHTSVTDGDQISKLRCGTFSDFITSPTRFPTDVSHIQYTYA